jgi:hypothetical protein
MKSVKRVEPFGWDSNDRIYFLLDDNRLYRQTEPPPPPPPVHTPKKSSKKGKAALRASKRRKLSEPAASEEDVKDEANADVTEALEEVDGLGGAKWECIAITLEEVNTLISSFEKSRDPNEKILRNRIIEDLLPLLEKAEESRKRKQLQKERELLNLEKLATAKRSSRIAGKIEHQKHEEEARESERRKQADLIMAKKEQEKWLKLEKERESRMMTREQRVKEREARRILHEEELASLSEDSKKLEAGHGRLSERHLKAEIERKKQALEQLAEEDDWIFDCICGAYGQVDDGTHSIACEKCNIWQHTACVGISEEDAGRDDFHFICKSCKNRELEAEKAKNRPSIKIKFNRPGSSSSTTPPTPQMNGSFIQNGTPGHNGVKIELSPPKEAQIHQPSPSKPAYGSPYQNGSQPALPQPHIYPFSTGVSMSSPSLKPDGSATSRSPNGIRSLNHVAGSPGSQNAFSPPHRSSPISLPPPQPSLSYASINGQNPQSSPSDGANVVLPPAVSAQPATHNPVHATPNNRNALFGTVASQNRGTGDSRASLSFPSPLVGALILSPSPSYRDMASASFPPQPTRPSSSYLASSPLQMHATPSNRPPGSDPGHLSALPPATTGISPIKHSPPRPTTANGMASFGSATPSVLPPVDSLSPSPRQQNLSPPVKSSDPERSRMNGQNHAQ